MLVTKAETWLTGKSVSAFRLVGSRESLALAGVLFLHLALVIPLAATLNIWIDEAYTLRTTGSGLVHALRSAINFELQPPLYYIILTLWRILNESAFFARLFSILCTASTVLLAGRIARRYLPGVHPALVAAVVAFNPLTVYAAVEVRFYALALLLSGLLLMFFYDGYVAEKPCPAARCCYTASAAAALYTHYFLGFILVAGGAALLVLWRGAALRKYLLGMVVTVLLFAPFAVVTVQQLGSVAAEGVDPQTLVEGSRLIWKSAWRYILPPVSDDGTGAMVRGWLSRLALPLALLAALFRRRRPSDEVLVSLTFVAVVGVFFVGVAMRLGPDFIRPHHTIVLYLPLLLGTLAVVQYTIGIRAIRWAVVVSLVFAGPYLVETYAGLAKFGDFIRVSRYIEQNERASEPILVFKPVFVLNFGYHYAGRNEIIPVPGPVPEDHFDLKATEGVLRNEWQIFRVLSGRVSASRVFWLVMSHSKAFRGIDVHPEILEAFVARHCIVLRDEWFNHARVRLLELRPRSWEGDAREQPLPLPEWDRKHAQAKQEHE